MRNARIITLDRRRPRATAMLAVGGRITWVGDGPPQGVSSTAGADVLDCEGATVLPGFIDPHCHPLSLGAQLEAIDCGPGTAGSIKEIKAMLRAAARLHPRGWLKAAFYDEFRLAEHRHPTREDLDAAVPERPVRLVHGSGHALVLNSAGLRAVGIGSRTPEPPGGTIDRDPSTGELTGLLLEMNDFVAARMPRPSEELLRTRAERASEALVSAGVTSVTDAGYRNDFSRLELYRRLHAEGRFKPRTTVMMAPDAELAGVSGDGWVRPGAVKLMLSCSGGRLSPPAEELLATTRAAMAGGAGSLAIHAVEETAVLAACEALASCAPVVGITRIEHASQSPPAAVDAIARSGAAVVTQPGLIRRRGERYLEAAGSGGPSLSYLYPLRSLIDAGVLVAGSTDAPYGSWHPLEGIATAMTRTSRGGQVIGSEEAVGVEEALELFGPSAAAVEGIGRSRGSLQVGKVADFVVLDVDPLESDPAALIGATVLRTVIAGATVWSPTAA